MGWLRKKSLSAHPARLETLVSSAAPEGPLLALYRLLGAMISFEVCVQGVSAAMLATSH